MPDSRQPLRTLGREWGTFSSCDEIDNLCWLFYDVQLSIPGIPPFRDSTTDLLINYDKGTAELQDDAGCTLTFWNIADLLPQLAPAKDLETTE